VKFYFSSHHIEQLNGYSFKEKQQLLNLAQSRLTAPEKFILNLLKLLLLIPPFWWLAQLNSWFMLLPVVFLLLVYFLLLRPLSLSFSARHLASAIKGFEPEPTEE
jgi:hypothetical protein